MLWIFSVTCKSLLSILVKGKEHLVLLFSERFEEPLITIRLSTTVVQMERSAQVYPILRSSYVNLIFHNVLINFPRRFSHRSPQELQLDIARLTELRYEENISRKGKNNHSPQFLKTWSIDAPRNVSRRPVVTKTFRCRSPNVRRSPTPRSPKTFERWPTETMLRKNSICGFQELLVQFLRGAGHRREWRARWERKCSRKSEREREVEATARVRGRLDERERARADKSGKCSPTRSCRVRKPKPQNEITPAQSFVTTG